MTRLRSLLLLATLLTLAATLAGGCGTLGYYVQSAHGHFSVMHASHPIAEVLQDPDLDPALRQRLERVREIRAFASRELALPDNGAFTRYADLQRPYVVWNVVAAPELSLTPLQSCFPIAGCVSYRGYFNKTDAETYAAQLEADGNDVQIAGVPAYSTLGWFDDPVLNTFVMQSEPRLAGLIFHELAHQQVYLKGDTTFNESFATAVEQEGLRRWLAHRNEPALADAQQISATRRDDFLALLQNTRTQLADLYASTADDTTKRLRKKALFEQLQTDYQQLKQQRWNSYSGYDAYFAQKLGNAHLASIATYTRLVPAFEALLARHPDDFSRLYAEVATLADLAPSARNARLTALCPSCMQQDSPGDPHGRTP